MAYDSLTGTLHLAPKGAEGTLYTVNASSGALSAGPKLGGSYLEEVAGMTYHDGALLLLSSAYWNGGTTLYSADPSTGAITAILALNDDVDAIASELP